MLEYCKQLCIFGKDCTGTFQPDGKTITKDSTEHCPLYTEKLRWKMEFNRERYFGELTQSA